MGTVLASALIRRASELGEDENNTLWRSEQALDWLNEAQNAICLAKPDACSVLGSIRLDPGSRQRSTKRKMLKLVRNMGEDGNTPGRAINLVDMQVMSLFKPDWSTATAGPVVREWMMDERDDTLFYVYPPVHGLANVYVEALEAVNPTPVATVNDTISVGDEWQPAVVEWMCYRFFGRDNENTPNYQRSVSHLNNFAQMIGTGWKSEVMVSEEAREA